MGHHKSSSKVALAVLVALLSMTWLAFATPVDFGDVGIAGPSNQRRQRPTLETIFEHAPGTSSGSADAQSTNQRHRRPGIATIFELAPGTSSGSADAQSTNQRRQQPALATITDPAPGTSSGSADAQSTNQRALRKQLPSPPQYGEYEMENAYAIMKYDTEQDENAKLAADWIAQEREIRAKTRVMLEQLEQHIDNREFWKNMDQYVTNKNKLLGLSKKWFPKDLSPAEINQVEKIDAVLSRTNRPRETLTETLLNLSGLKRFATTEEIAVKQKRSFEHALKKAMKIDGKRHHLSVKSLLDIAHAVIRADKVANYDQGFLDSLPRLKKHPLLKNAILRKGSLTSQQIDVFKMAVWDELRVFNSRRLSQGYHMLPSSYRRLPGFFKLTNPCKNVPKQRRRRSSSGCLFSLEEYGEIVREVETEGGIKEVLNTEKFLEMMDRMATEDSADIKRKQLLEIGASLAEDPEVTLEGDYVAQFKEVVASLDEAAIPSQMQDSIQRWQLPENPLGETHLVSESQALPLDHLSLGDIHPADRIGVYPHQETFREPFSIHDPVIEPHENFHEPPIIHNEEIFHEPVRPLGEIGGVISHEPMTGFQGEYKPVTMPEIIRPVESTPIKTFPFPEFKWPTIPKITLPKFTMPKFTLGKWG